MKCGMHTDMDFRERIRSKMDERGFKAFALAREAGLNESYIRDLLSGRSADPQFSKIEAVARALGVTLEWMMHGEGPEDIDAPRYEDDFVVRIPVFDLAASAGAGALIEDASNISTQPFRESYLRSLTAAPSEALAVIHVSGDSMEPTLRHGDTILIDRRADRLGPDGIYVLLFEDALMVKRCQRDFATGAVIIKSDNPLYQTMTLNDRDRIQIRGRVIWLGRAIG